MPAFAQDAETARFFRLALDLVEEDVSLAQEVIRDLATERRLSLIKDVLEGLSLTVTPSLAAHLWESRISSFFQIILHPVIVDSVVLELELATIYRSLLGVDTARLKRLYNFVFHIVDHWTELPFQSADASAIEALSLGCGVLAKVIDTSSANIVNAHFVSIVEKIQLRLDVFGDQEAAFYSVQASKYLEYVRRRLGIGHSLPDASISTQSAPVAEFVLSQDLPGTLSRRGRRHDNDHAQIADIKLMPTLNEIMSFRDEYLPTINPSQHHLKGLPGLLDRHFRLLREDTLHDLRNAIRTRVESTDRVREVRTKIVVYDYATAVEVTFDKRSGLEFIVKIDQPKAARALDKLERAAWWVQTKRLTDGTLVCIVDDMGDIFFFQVSRSTVRTLDDSNQRDQTSGERDGPRYSLSDDKRHAFVYLKLVDASIAEVRRSLLWFKNMGSRQHRQLFEFPSILLPAFAPPLKALQSMSEKLDLPFRHLLTLHGTDRPPVIDPPLYSKRPGFSFDLSSLSNDGSNLSYTPGNPIDPAGLSRHTTLDLTQSEAILNSLSRSFALIQGPPGTGKSYTGEALIKVLLANKSKAKLGPVMCVCYTNHALDQLLEHLIDADVQNIVRIGSRSKSERLEPVNLRKVAEGMTRTKTEGKAMYDSIEALESESSYVGQRLSTYKYLNTNEKIRALLSAQYKSLHDELFGSEQQDDGWETVRHGRRRAMETWLRGGTTNNTPSRPLDQLYYTRLSDMTHKERTILHQDWLRQALAPELERLSAAHETYEKTRERNNRIRSSIDLRCLQQANIIGVTTTGLATNLDLLRRVNGKVLLCEEAGEVLEAHLLTALLPTIEHAILIGDHLQLRPQIQDWRLQRANPAGVKYSLDVSLFERLVHPTIPNTPTLPFSILDTQRRMHPSISELIRSALYPSLADSDTVQDYPAVCGITKRLFWLHHESPESGRKSDQDSIETSYSNDFEVDMVAALVSHLLRQGVYKAGEIAVLTPYLGQLNKLRSKLGSTMQIVINDRDMDDLADLESADTPSQGNPKKEAAKSSALQGVRAATVDNFQGEEANVVIVSLVRSNNEKRCGFLSTSNRINVLLSRARHGMYIIGNSHTSSHVPMWAQAIDILQRDNNFGTELELQCPRHSDNRMQQEVPRALSSLCGRNVFFVLSAFQMQYAVCSALRLGSLHEAMHQALGMQPSVSVDEIKSTVVDLIMMSDYGSIDLNEEPCIFPDCGHFLTYSTMDGQMRLQDFYEISPEGFPTAVRGDSRPFDLSEKISVCPNCRGPLRNISRYGRIVRRGLLDESTKKFISWSNTEWQKLSEIFFNGQKALQELDKETFVFPVQPPGTYDLQGARHEQLNHLFKVTGASRHKNMAKVLRQIENFLGKVKREEQPYQRVAHLVWHVNKRRHKEAGGFSFDESAIQMGSYLQAMALLLRCELLVISDYLSLCRSPTDGVVKSAKVDVRTYLNDCEKLIQTARTRNYVRQEVEGHIFIGMFCSFVTPSSEPKPIETEKPATDTAEDKPTTPNKQTQHEEMKKLGLEHLEIAKELMGKHESTAVLKGECDTAWRMLHDGVFYSEVSQDEMRAVYQAMSREFLGTGHWYTCRNGHPFTIGECGMAMQAARCPECGAPVGGQNHQSAEGVRHAREIEQLGTGIAGMRL
ncbi:hypothetical protein CkaCkLH20_12110 [Colletotrichum karsti]|uniref:RZ-type domain-containing protein n=1 Tax=Colletotrichum karsti TaxID=1095194 RepID=A0A9P6HT25_9PEZI|nr:uncharacterized protein CkaCkLH20_12110 [Colletotrichum karsti]KAF9870443.1 hypothetical protein CkaCkLH20_12110 [Colletotrichum karsti]